MVKDAAARIEAPAPELPQSKRAFLEEYGRLLRQYSSDSGNPGSYACTDCERCTSCMFCQRCEACYGCTHCIQCELCNHCTHCRECKYCNGCAYCVQSEACAGSNYALLCRNLSDCNYCLGCVGLSKKDFHILNQPYSRTEYFKALEKLKKDLGLD